MNLNAIVDFNMNYVLRSKLDSRYYLCGDISQGEIIEFIPETETTDINNPMVYKFSSRDEAYRYMDQHDIVDYEVFEFVTLNTNIVLNGELITNAKN